jgi:hypothetical protein
VTRRSPQAARPRGCAGALKLWGSPRRGAAGGLSRPVHARGPTTPTAPARLRKGDDGAAILSVQRLQKLGWSGAVDGDFGAQTEAPVKASSAPGA